MSSKRSPAAKRARSRVAFSSNGAWAPLIAFRQESAQRLRITNYPSRVTGPGSAHLEHELSAQVPPLAHLVRRGGFGQRVNLHLRRADGAGGDERDDPLQVRAVAPDF